MLLRFLMVSAVLALGSDADLPTGYDVAQWAQQAQSWRNAGTVGWTSCQRDWPQESTSCWVTDTRTLEKELPLCCSRTSVTTWASTPDVETVTDPDAAFTQAMNQTVSVFVADLSAPSENVVPTALLAQQAPSKPAWEPVDLPENLYPGIAYELNESNFDLVKNSNAEIMPEIVSAEVDSPLEIAATSHHEWEIETTCEAPAESDQEVARVEEPVQPPADTDSPIASEPAVVEPSSGQRISAAVKLTGQAIHAWASLLQAPTVAYHDSASAVSR